MSSLTALDKAIWEDLHDDHGSRWRDWDSHGDQWRRSQTWSNSPGLFPVVAGQADAALVPTFAPQVITRAAPDKLVLAFPQPLTSATTAFGVRKGDADFLNFLNSWVAVQRDEGWFDERTAYWANPSNWLK